MGSCLKTQLKEEVNNPFLRRLDDIVTYFKSGFNGEIVGNASTIEVYNMAGVLQDTYFNYVALEVNYDGFIRIKNSANAIGIAKMDNAKLMASDFANFNITGAFSAYDSNFGDSLENIVKWFPNTNQLNLRRTNITGNLDCMVSNNTLVLSHLTYLNISNCQVTCKRSTINKIEAILGNDFKYSGVIIIEDV